MIAQGVPASGTGAPNNMPLLLRTMAGFVIHPNVGAMVLLDREGDAITSDDIMEYLRGGKRTGTGGNDGDADADKAAMKRALAGSIVKSMRVTGDWQQDLLTGQALVQGCVTKANETCRTKQPLKHIKIAQQCGGSDAFSGVSGNPLAGWVARELIKHGGAAVLAETDELIVSQEVSEVDLIVWR